MTDKRKILWIDLDLWKKSYTLLMGESPQYYHLEFYSAIMHSIQIYSLNI